MMLVTPSDHIQAQIFWYGFYEKEAILTFEAMLDSNSVVVDIGANSGYYSLIAAPKVKTVIAFEPSTIARDRLQKNLSLNNITNVSVQSLALSDVSGISELYISGPDNSGMTGFVPAENFNGCIETVNIDTLDDWAMQNKVTEISFVKIDVEGAEKKVLTGMSSLLSINKPIIFIEIVHEQLKNYQAGIEDIYDLLLAKGYFAYEILEPCKIRKLSHPAESFTVLFIHSASQIPSSISLMAQS